MISDSGIHDQPTALALDLIERAYTFLVTSNSFDVRFMKGPTRERRHARAFLGHPLLDGWNIISTAQTLALCALPRPLTTQVGFWPWLFRKQLCACLLIAAKWKKGDILASPDIRVAYCFMTQTERISVSSDSLLKSSVLDQLFVVQLQLLCSSFSFSISEGIMVDVEDLLNDRLTAMGTERTFVARNLALFQVRALMRRAPKLLFGLDVADALVFNSDHWMCNNNPRDLSPRVCVLATKIRCKIEVTKCESDWIGPFGDAKGHTGKYISSILSAFKC